MTQNDFRADVETGVPVDWSSYAQQYDLMAENNPAYQELLLHCVQTVSDWGLQPGDTLADFAAGTGNISLAIAAALPEIMVLHVELNEGMIAFAQAKAAAAGLRNWQVLRLDLTQPDWPIPELAGAVTVHALYALPQPKKVIDQICARLRPGGRVYAADFGRTMDVRAWSVFLLRAALKRHGLVKTISLFARSGIVRRENRRITACQKSGQFWLHEMPEFRAAFEACGMEITFASDKYYRGCDDVILARASRP